MSKFFVSSSVHLKSEVTTRKIMLDVIIALCPAVIASGIFFGLSAVMLIAVCVLSCVLAEYICRKLMKRENTIDDLSAVVTGILLAFNLPPTINPLIAVVGSVVAIVVVKQMFGGLGQNFVNPALTARIVLMVSFPTAMTTWVKPFFYNNTADAVSSATPLVAASNSGVMPSYLEMFLGTRAGCLGETCAAALIIGGVYLVFKKVISPIIPLTFIATVFILSYLFGSDPVYAILSGGVMLGAIFMATDYVTSPLTTSGKVIFALGCGLITVLIREFGSLPEGVSFSIVIMNILVPHIEKITTPRSFGKEKKNAKNEG